MNIAKAEAELNSWYPSEVPAYRIVKTIAAGTYSHVFLGTDLTVPATEDQQVAIKRISPTIFEDSTATYKILRENCIMAHFVGHPNIVELRDVAPVHGDFTHMFVVMEYVELTLATVLRQCQMLTWEHVEYFLYQLLCALKCMHEAGVTHGDIRPKNILVNPATCDLKLTSFGLPMQDPTSDDAVFSIYWSPEMCMKSEQCDDRVDMWGVGCILAELFSPFPRKPLFSVSGQANLLAAILKVVGTPDPADASRMGSVPAQQFVLRHYAHARGVDFQARFRFPEGTPLTSDALDLLQRLLEFCPWKRISAAEALRHPYLRTIRECRYDDEEWRPGEFTCPFEEHNDYRMPDLVKVKKEIADNIPKIRAKLVSAHTHAPPPSCLQQQLPEPL